MWFQQKPVQQKFPLSRISQIVFLTIIRISFVGVEGDFRRSKQCDNLEGDTASTSNRGRSQIAVGYKGEHNLIISHSVNKRKNFVRYYV